jgi:hypothetical protein
MVKNFVIVIPSQEKKHEICDFLSQTAQTLNNNNNLVIILQLKESYSIKEILVSLFHNKKIIKLVGKKNGIYYIKPLFIIPFRRFEFIYNLNLKINCLLLQVFIEITNHHKKKLLWMFFPHEEKLTSYFGERWFILYDIVDFYTLPTKKENQLLEIKKKKLLKKSHLTTAISNSLKIKYSKLTNKKIYQVPQGFQLIKNKPPIKNRKRNKKKQKPIIGYIGHINNRFDLKLLKGLMSKNIQWNFVFVGPKHHDNNISYQDQSIKINDLFKLKNVFWVKEQPKKNISKFISKFDICIIPYDTKYNFNKFCYPMKLFEYFSIGKPVISTPIQELLLPKFKDIIRIGKNHEEWENHINNIILNNWTQKQKEKQNKMSLNNSWEHKIKKISSLIVNHL